jgi:lambda family phage tail tape measure protein
MTSNRTVKFEFQVEADDRQLGRFRDALGKINSATAVSESVLSGLRKELVSLSQATVQTENGLQAQIAALRDASRNADLTKSEYTSLRLEVSKLEKEYKLLTTNIVGLDKTYKVATQSARQFSQEQLAAAQRTNNLYLNNSGQRSADAANRAQFLAGTSGAANIFPVDPTSQLGFQQRIANLRQEATLVGMGTDAYKERALAINKLEQEYQQLSRVEDQSTIDTRSRLRRRQQRREIANVASSVAIGGFFGGLEGFAGSAAGALAGSFMGPGGALAGAQIGSSIGLGLQQARLGATAVADMVAQLNLAKTALAQVSANQADYNQKLEFSRQVSTDYSVGLQATIEGYSKVTAAAAANGLTLKETETIYRGLLASGVAFGASQDDLQSIITATTQILSKGKISAEELSGQLGERIPGAVAKFAQATGRPLAQLAKDLQDGKVNIADFVKFAKGQLDDYDKAAKLIGSSPEKAGERLNLALTRMAESYGGFFQSVGAGFQDFATKFINWINSQSQGIKTMVGLLNWAGREVYKFQANTPAVRAFQSLTSQLSGSSVQRPPEGFASNPSDPYGVGRSPFMAAPPKKAQDPFANFFADRLREGNSLFPQLEPTLFNQSKSNPIPSNKTAADDEKAKKAADKETKLREQLASEERRRAELLANNAIRLADRVFEHQQNLIRKRYELENSLLEATRRAQESALVGPAREALAFANRLKANREDEIRQVREVRQNTALMQQGVRSSVAQAANTARYADVPQSAVGMRSGSNGGVFALTGGRPGSPNAGQSTGAHLDVRWADRRRISAADADRFFEVNGRAPSSFGVASGYGPRSLFGRSFHAGIDFGTPEGGRLSLKNGATFAGMMSPSESGGGGLTGIINTPMGQMKVLHLEKILTKATAGATTRTQSGVASGQGRFITDMGDVRMSEQNLINARKEQQLTEANIGPISQQKAIAETNAFTESYRLQTKALQDQQQELTLRNELILKGVRPEVIDQQVSLNQLTRDYAETLTTLQVELGKIDSKKEPQKYKDLADSIKLVTEATDKRIAAQIALDTVSSVNTYKTQTKSIQDQLSEFKLRNRLQMEGVRPEIVDQQVELDRVTRAYTATLNSLQVQLASINERQKPEQYAAKLNQINQETAAYKEQIAAQEALNKAQNDKRYIFNFDESAKAGIDGYITSIGTLNEAVTGLTQKGFGGLQSSIKELVTTGSTDFKAFALSMISDMLDIVIQQLVVAQFAQMLRNILGGVPGGGGGFQMPPAAFIPTGGYGFANGGVMTSSGPLKLQTYARGGIADRPQMALFGEGSSPEAYVPLPDGRRIPVAMQGGAGSGGISVSVNVDASGTKAEGNSDRAAAMGKELGNVIEAKIISMQRPGGLLYYGNN